MTKLFKKKSLWVILILLISLGTAVVLYFLRSDKEDIYTTQKVMRQNLKQTVSATGSIKASDELNLSFEVSGKISQINVAVGDRVITGQVLAGLQTSDLSTKVVREEASVIEAEANLNKIIAGATAEEIEISKIAVSNAQVALENAKLEQSDTEKTYLLAYNNSKEDVITESDEALTKAKISIDTTNDSLNNDDYDTYVSAATPIYLMSANSKYTAVSDQITVAKNKNALAKKDYDDNAVDSAVDETLDVLDSVTDYLNTATDALNNSITGGDLTQTKLDTLKSSVNTEKNTTNTSIATVLSADQDVADAKLSYETEVNDSSSSVSDLQEKLNKAEAELALKLAPARSEDISLYRARLKQAQADLLLARQNLAKSYIKSPLEGIVTAVLKKHGERVSELDTILTVFSSLPYEIEVNIPESDVAKIKIGNFAEIDLDAFPSDLIFSGKVIKIDPAQTNIQDVVYYKITVSLDENQPESIAGSISLIRPGMTANVNILTETRDNVIVVAQRAVSEKNGKKIIQLYDNNKVSEVEVTTGLKGDDGLIEIISGLKEGQTVVTYVKEKK
ncbi:efflux RND transporter periplasmic adaptor subunit [Candidatus Parcubacteria bacterium]|nr:MAG: efflux RND transporter periplasmic adaptor subunit [Candidatus Parcubacteria bacterium]